MPKPSTVSSAKELNAHFQTHLQNFKSPATVQERITRTEGYVVYETQQNGPVEICLRATSASPQNPMRFAMHIEKESEVHVHDNDMVKTSADRHYTHMELEMQHLVSSMKDIIAEADFSKEREMHFHHQTLSMHAASMWWPIVQLCVLLLTGFTQANHVVRFLKSQRLIWCLAKWYPGLEIIGRVESSQNDTPRLTSIRIAAVAKCAPMQILVSVQMAPSLISRYGANALRPPIRLSECTRFFSNCCDVSLVCSYKCTYRNSTTRYQVPVAYLTTLVLAVPGTCTVRSTWHVLIARTIQQWRMLFSCSRDSCCCQDHYCASFWLQPYQHVILFVNAESNVQHGTNDVCEWW